MDYIGIIGFVIFLIFFIFANLPRKRKGPPTFPQKNGENQDAEDIPELIRYKEPQERKIPEPTPEPPAVHKEKQRSLGALPSFHRNIEERHIDSKVEEHHLQLATINTSNISQCYVQEEEKKVFTKPRVTKYIKNRRHLILSYEILRRPYID